MSFLTDYYTTVDNSIRLKALGIVLLEAVINIGLLAIISLLIGSYKSVGYYNKVNDLFV